MEKYVLNIILKIRNKKKIMTATEINDVLGDFVVKLCGLKMKDKFNNL